MPIDRAPAPLAQLADTLWPERRLLEYLLFKLVSANLILTADAAPFVPLTIDEVEQVMGRVREAEAHRRRVLAEVAGFWDVDPAAVTLDFLARTAPEPLRPAFSEHRAGFMSLVDEIERVTLENRRLAALNLETIRGTLGLAAGDRDVSGYAGGRPDPVAAGPTSLDQVI